jgi:DNA-binding transcriptional LysR family regulator
LTSLRNEFDIALRLGPGYGSDLIGVKLSSTNYVSMVDRITEPSELAARDCLRQALRDYRSRWLFKRDGTVEEGSVTGSFVISSPLSLRQAALDGLGPALLPNWLIDDDLSAGRLIDLRPRFEVAATSFETGAWLLYPSRSYMPTKVRAAIDFLRANLRPRNDIESAGYAGGQA